MSNKQTVKQQFVMNILSNILVKMFSIDNILNVLYIVNKNAST